MSILIEQVKHLNTVLECVSQVSMHVSYKLADMVNVAIEEGTYFKSKEWCKINCTKMMVEHKQVEWTKELFTSYQKLKAVEKVYGAQSDIL